MAMAGKTERRMAMDCRENLPVGRNVFPPADGTSKKNRNVENKDIDFVNE